MLYFIGGIVVGATSVILATSWVQKQPDTMSSREYALFQEMKRKR